MNQPLRLEYMPTYRTHILIVVCHTAAKMSMEEYCK
nr:MAG TPA: hypothetical protein [Caudoviricetes sp.]